MDLNSRQHKSNLRYALRKQKRDRILRRRTKKRKLRKVQKRVKNLKSKRG